MPESDMPVIESRIMGLDIALCGLLETLARIEPSIAKALAEDIRAKAAQLQHSNTTLAAEATRRANVYAEILERIGVGGENLGTQNTSLNALRGGTGRAQ